jgi:hypothetical protein
MVEFVKGKALLGPALTLIAPCWSIWADRSRHHGII